MATKKAVFVNTKERMRREVERATELKVEAKKLEAVMAWWKETEEIKAVLHFADGRKSVTFRHQG